jgi:hypothetical protein
MEVRRHRRHDLWSSIAPSERETAGAVAARQHGQGHATVQEQIDAALGACGQY